MATSLLTGGAGFLGSHLCTHLLQAGHKVVVMDDLSGGYRRNVESRCVFVEDSIGNAKRLTELFDRYRFDYIFHLAAYAAEGMSHFVRCMNYETNLVNSVRLVNFAVNYGVKCFVFTSSAAVYGSSVPGKSEDFVHPDDPYAIAKFAVEQDIQTASRVFGLPHVIFRPHNIYGKRQNLCDPFRNVIGIFFNQIKKGEACTIFGDGTQTRNFSYVDDVVPLLARCVTMPEAIGKTFNVGSDQSTSLNELAALMQNIANSDVGICYLPERPEAHDVRVDHTQKNRVFGNQPEVDLEEGLRQMWQWARELEIGSSNVKLRLEIDKKLPDSWRAILGPEKQ